MAHSAEARVRTIARQPSGRGGEVIPFTRGRSRREPPCEPFRVALVGGHSLERAGLRLLLEEDRKLVVVGESEQVAGPVCGIVRAGGADVVLLDVVAVEGEETLTQVRRLARDPSYADVVLLTESDADDRRFWVLPAGARGVLSKDTDPTQLRRAVRRVAGDRDPATLAAPFISSGPWSPRSI
jgi:DNA-binding NarL/FixJ family response regulator